MLIKLSNGKKFRLSWQHIDVSRPTIRQLALNKEFEEINTRERLFQNVLNTYYPKQFLKMYERLHGVSECYLVELVKGDERLEKANGSAFCSIHDPFDREVGRRQSLLYALDVVFPLDGAKDAKEWKENKLLRREVWEAYRNSTKEPRW